MKKLWEALALFTKKFDKRKVVEKYLLDDLFLDSIRNTEYVSSRGILFNTDIHNLSPQSSNVDTHFINHLPDNINNYFADLIPSVYICSDEINLFAEIVLPKIKKPFVLVSGDSDISVNYSNFGKSIDEILNCKFLKRWFCQNIDFDHEKLNALPIGMDYHSVWRDPKIWSDPHPLPSDQEIKIKSIKKRTKPAHLRDDKIFCNWHFSLSHGQRKDCFNRVNKQLCFFQSSTIPRYRSWELQTEFKFVLSPNGQGIDCHRTWEALILGCIPIIQPSLVAEKLFKNLPVIVIDDWEALNQAFLLKKFDFLNFNFDSDVLRLNYWVNEINHSKNVSQA